MVGTTFTTTIVISSIKLEEKKEQQHKSEENDFNYYDNPLQPFLFALKAQNQKENILKD